MCSIASRSCESAREKKTGVKVPDVDCFGGLKQFFGLNVMRVFTTACYFSVNKRKVSAAPSGGFFNSLHLFFEKTLPLRLDNFPIVCSGDRVFESKVNANGGAPRFNFLLWPPSVAGYCRPPSATRVCPHSDEFNESDEWLPVVASFNHTDEGNPNGSLGSEDFDQSLRILAHRKLEANSFCFETRPSPKLLSRFCEIDFEWLSVGFSVLKLKPHLDYLGFLPPSQATGDTLCDLLCNVRGHFRPLAEIYQVKARGKFLPGINKIEAMLQELVIQLGGLTRALFEFSELLLVEFEFDLPSEHVTSMQPHTPTWKRCQHKRKEATCGVRIVEVFDEAGAPTSRAFEQIEPRLHMEPPIDLSHPNGRLRTTNY